MEIERKFLVDRIPFTLEGYVFNEIRQGYLDSDDPNTEKRVRKKGEKYFYSVKTKGGLSREEEETEITEAKFLIFWESTQDRRIEKIRYEIPFSGKTIEFDIYTGKLEGLLIAEVEFGSEEEARGFAAPEWFGKEVTNDERYRNGNLAVNGIPQS